MTMGVRNLPQDAWKHVERGEDEACWFWTGSIDSHGYGRFSVGGQSRLAHRVIYELSRDEDIRGSLICHTCDERRCVNPAHLYRGTPADNMRDMVERGRDRRRGNAKLTEAQVREVRQMSGMGHTQREIAAWFGVTQPAIGYLLRGRTWRHV